MKHDAKANNEFIKKNHKETITFMKEPYYFPSGHATSHRAMLLPIREVLGVLGRGG
jgi:hypothetical protein